MKFLILLLALGACVLSVSSANIPHKNDHVEIPLKPDTSVARGGWGSASEFWSGPPAVFLALPISIIFILVLWVSAYNTLRSGPPKIGFGGGAQGGGLYQGWQQGGGWQQAAPSGWAAPVVSGGGGWAAEESAPQPQATPVQPQVEQTVAATGQRSLNDLTHRVLTSIERGEQAQY